MSQKVILAFSGGLDTCFSIPYLMEKGYEVVTVTCDSSGMSQEALEQVQAKSKKLGAVKHYTVDIREELFDEIISFTIKTNGVYEGSYPNLCADRYLIAKTCANIAKQENASFIAHGSTAMGNDQVRFNLALEYYAPEVTILEPIKEIGGSREYEIAYLQDKGFEVPKKHTKYSINENIMGITYSGSEIDKNQEPLSEMFVWVTGKKKDEEAYFDITFEAGLPVAINGKPISGPALIETLNTTLGALGYGKHYYTGDCIIGIKGHIVLEAPALFFLISAHKALAQYTLTKLQQDSAYVLSKQATDLIYNGKLFDPTMKDLRAYFESLNSGVNGTVRMKIEFSNAQAVSVSSPNALVSASIATYAQSCSWTKQDAAGFIKLYGLQSKIAQLVQDSKK